MKPVRICPMYAGFQKGAIMTTSRSNNWSKGLSPFLCGPVKLYGKFTAKNVENAWQYSKVYEEFEDDIEGYFAWAKKGWKKERADRYPMGKGRKPMFSFWNWEKLDYINARKQIYCPLYAKVVAKTPAFARLQRMYKRNETIWLADFDGYDHVKLGMSYEDVINEPKRKMGHAFVLGMMLEGKQAWH